MLLIPYALCWSSRKSNCACALTAEVQLLLHVTYTSCQKLFSGKNLVKILVTAQTQLHSCSEQQRTFGNSNICNSIYIMLLFIFFFFFKILADMTLIHLGPYSQKRSNLTAHHKWQKWKRVFLTCPCHTSYRDEAVGLKSCKYTCKITIKIFNHFIKKHLIKFQHVNLFQNF